MIPSNILETLFIKIVIRGAFAETTNTADFIICFLARAKVMSKQKEILSEPPAAEEGPTAADEPHEPRPAPRAARAARRRTAAFYLTSTYKCLRSIY